MIPEEKACVVRTGFNGGIDVIFGNGGFGAIPEIGARIVVSYIKTDGSGGNIFRRTRNDWRFLEDVFDGNGDTIDVTKVFDIDIEEAIKRDSTRGKYSVGEAVIRKQFKELTRGKKFNAKPYREQNITLPKAVIVDLDGTLCKMNDRSPYEYDLVDTDLPNEPVVNLVENLLRTRQYKIIFLSGRPDSCRNKTIDWIRYENCFVFTKKKQKRKLY
jgi:hypothetical protein